MQDSPSLTLIILVLCAIAAAFAVIYLAINKFVRQPVSVLSSTINNIVRESNFSSRVDISKAKFFTDMQVLATDFNVLLDFIEYEIRERTATEDRMRFMAHYDSLTELPNRLLLHDRMGQFIAHSKRVSEHFAVLFLDLDRFKIINDTMGHSAGDKLLQDVSRRLLAEVRDEDTVARLGGDEFVVVLNECNKDGARMMAEKIIDAIRAPYLVNGQQIVSQTSIGIATYPHDGDNVETLIKHADIAMYQAKKDGRNSFRFYDDGMNFHLGYQYSVEKDLRVAIENNQQNNRLYLDFQPQMDIDTGAPCGVEALIRWNHPQRGRVSPDEFIPVAEETGQILQIEQWVLNEACRSARQWIDAGVNIPVAVNISAHLFQRLDFIASVSGALRDSGLPANMLEIEITESVMMGGMREALNAMNVLREMGVLLSVDDFGTGFSSLSYIRQMPITQIKIDKAFIGDIESGEHMIAEHIITLGHRLGLEVLAEGVETPAQFMSLRMMGCNKMQGFYYAKPMLIGALIDFFSTPPDKAVQLRIA